MSKLSLIAAISIVVLISLPALAEEAAEEKADFVGSVKTLKGEVTIRRGEDEITPKVGTHLMQSDVLVTGEKSSVGIILRDDTTVSLGSGSELAMKEFKFEPDEGLFSLALDFVKGTLVYASGRIGKLSPESVEVETPVGIVAVRGTRFMARID